ncbi:hypothetical protein D3C85_1225360 [compost metagenome]
MLRTFAYGIYIRHRGLQIIIDHDPTVNRNAALLGQQSVRLNPDSHDHKIRCQLRSVTETKSVNPFITSQFNGLFAHGKLYALAGKFCLKHRGRIVIQLPFHQIFQEMHYSYVHAEVHKSFGCFQSQQSAADNSCRAVLLGCCKHSIAIRNIAEAHYPFLVTARNRQNERIRACGNDGLIIRNRQPVICDNLPRCFINSDNSCSCVQRNVVICIPLAVIKDDLFDCFAAFKHVGQHNPIVIGMRLTSEHSNIISAAKLQNLLYRAYTCHAVTDEY